jgi:hypothetical protein
MRPCKRHVVLPPGFQTMIARHRAMFATSTLLYAGPLYAGLAGYGFETMPLFAVFFMVWLAIVRPGDWPETRQEWLMPRALAWPLLIFVGQLGVVAFSLVMGSSLGGISGLDLPLPFASTLILCFSAILLARILRGSESVNYMRVPGESLGLGAGILDISAPSVPGRRGHQAFIEEVSTYLAMFGAAPAPRTAIEPLIDMIMRENMAKPVMGAFRHSKIRRLPYIQAEAMLAMRPGMAGALLGKGQIGSAIGQALATGEPDIVATIAQLARDLVHRLPDSAAELPPEAELLRLAGELQERSAPAASALRDLAATLGGHRKAA